MNYYSLIPNSDYNEKIDGALSYLIFDEESELLTSKKLYEPYSGPNPIKSIVLDPAIHLIDVIHCYTLSVKGFLVSSAFYDIVKDFSLADIQFYDVQFANAPTLEGYKFMFFNSDLTYHIDYDASQFRIRKKMPLASVPAEYIEIEGVHNRDNIIEADKEASRSIFKKVVPKSKYVFNINIEQYDVMRIGHFDYAFYFSERVVEALKAAELTGFNLVKSGWF